MDNLIEKLSKHMDIKERKHDFKFITEYFMRVQLVMTAAFQDEMIEAYDGAVDFRKMVMQQFCEKLAEELYGSIRDNIHAAMDAMFEGNMDKAEDLLVEILEAVK